MNRDELLQRLTALDFYIIDLNLYLNTHPDDRDAISNYNDMVVKARELRDQYEEKYGMLMATMSQSNYPWQWIDDPWPWQCDFNFELGVDR